MVLLTLFLPTLPTLHLLFHTAALRRILLIFLHKPHHDIHLSTTWLWISLYFVWKPKNLTWSSNILLDFTWALFYYHSTTFFLNFYVVATLTILFSFLEKVFQNFVIAVLSVSIHSLENILILACFSALVEIPSFGGAPCLMLLSFPHAPVTFYQIILFEMQNYLFIWPYVCSVSFMKLSKLCEIRDFISLLSSLSFAIKRLAQNR